MSDQKRKMIGLTINDKPVSVEEGTTVLDAARDIGIHIPTLCHHESVEPAGTCRLCVVEVGESNWSKIVVSCMYPVKEGIKVQTDSERVTNVRRWVLEMLLAECPASPEIRELAAQYDVISTRFKTKDPDQDCMLCGLCVRVCREVAGVAAVATIGRGVDKKIGAPYMTPTAECIGCGLCTTICPTGAMQARLDKIRILPRPVQPGRELPKGGA